MVAFRQLLSERWSGEPVPEVAHFWMLFVDPDRWGAASAALYFHLVRGSSTTLDSVRARAPARGRQAAAEGRPEAPPKEPGLTQMSPTRGPDHRLPPRTKSGSDVARVDLPRFGRHGVVR